MYWLTFKKKTFKETKKGHTDYLYSRKKGIRVGRNVLLGQNCGKAAPHFTAQIKQIVIYVEEACNRLKMANFHLACHHLNPQKTYFRDKCECARTHTHACTQGHTYRTHPQITVWLTKQEVGKPTQSDRCHDDGQWEQGGGLMRGSEACLAKWDCQSLACRHEFKECGKSGGGQSGTAKLSKKRSRRVAAEKEDEEEEKEENEGWKAPEVWVRGGRGGGGLVAAAITLSGSPRGSC